MLKTFTNFFAFFVFCNFDGFYAKLVRKTCLDTWQFQLDLLEENCKRKDEAQVPLRQCCKNDPGVQYKLVNLGPRGTSSRGHAKQFCGHANCRLGLLFPNALQDRIYKNYVRENLHFSSSLKITKNVSFQFKLVKLGF